MTDEDLKELCILWQKRLRLQDWEVSVRFGHTHEMDDRYSTGTVWYSPRRRQATIKVLFPDEVEPSDFPFDPERTLIHELLHLYFAPFDTAKNSPEEDAEEIAVNALAAAFVEVARHQNTADAQSTSGATEKTRSRKRDNGTPAAVKRGKAAL